MEQKIYGITELNEHIKSILDGAPELAGIYVRGEISNFKVYNPGNCFFTLKDETGALKCVMYRNQAGRLRFQPQNGMKVIALGRVAVFPRTGSISSTAIPSPRTVWGTCIWPSSS